MASGDNHKHVIKVSIENGINNVLIGQAVEIPSLIVQAKTKKLLMKEMVKAFNAYFDAFPEEHDKVFHGSKQKSLAQSEREEIPVTIQVKHKKT
jgi:hypothetical protein